MTPVPPSTLAQTSSADNDKIVRAAQGGARQRQRALRAGAAALFAPDILAAFGGPVTVTIGATMSDAERADARYEQWVADAEPVFAP